MQIILGAIEFYPAMRRDVVVKNQFEGLEKSISNQKQSETEKN
jgi:hypothetical protein